MAAARAPRSANRSSRWTSKIGAGLPFGPLIASPRIVSCYRCWRLMTRAYDTLGRVSIPFWPAGAPYRTPPEAAGSVELALIASIRSAITSGPSLTNVL